MVSFRFRSKTTIMKKRKRFGILTERLDDLIDFYQLLVLVVALSSPIKMDSQILANTMGDDNLLEIVGRNRVKKEKEKLHSNENN